MRIIFVRHGNPNYQLDCLTELGHRQAAAAAERLSGMGIEEIYSSTCGRAMQTAEHTATLIGKEIHPCDFMRELDWSLKPGAEGAVSDPWAFSREYIARGECLVDHGWMNNDCFSKTMMHESCMKLADGLDRWLESLGYTRDGYYYRVGKAVHGTVAMFCHAGAFSAAYGHMFNLPIPFVLLTVPFAQTGIYEVELVGKEGELITPCIYKQNCVAHLAERGIEVPW